jgi:catalase
MTDLKDGPQAVSECAYLHLRSGFRGRLSPPSHGRQMRPDSNDREETRRPFPRGTVMSTKPEMKKQVPDELSRETLKTFDDVTGLHPGFRPVHAKGILLSGTFTASAGGKELTKAPHVQRDSVPVVVRFSDFAGVPTVPDYDVENASPRGCAVRFFLAEHSHTDIIGHSVNGFPTRTLEEFLQFLKAVGASGPDAPKPTPVEAFLGSHPAALAFVQAPKPIPTSFAKESFYGVNAYKFVNGGGVEKFGRYRIVPQDGNEYLDSAEAAKKSPNFLFDDIKARTTHGGVKMRVLVQIATGQDVVDDATVKWPDDRPIMEFGTIEVNGQVPDNDAAQRHIIFDPIPRVEGIEPSGDPLLDPRASVYLASGRRRRAASV